MGVAIPTSIDDINAGWLKSATGLDVASADIQLIGVGVGVASAVYRATLTGANCPASVIIKIPALDPAAVFTSTVLRMYIREVRFFATLAAQCPVRVPRSYYGDINEETSQFVMVLEDIGAMRIVDQNVGMAIEDARCAIDALAKIHATWWGKANALAADGTTVSLGDPIYPAILPMVFAEGWEKVNNELEIPDSIVEIGQKFAPAIAGMLSSLMEGPTTLIHGDFRADNMLFTDDNQVALLDFQLIGTGTGAYDLAYFVTQSISAQDASLYEHELFDRWIDELRLNGVTDLDRDQLWKHYRTAALFCLVYPVVASRGMDLSEPRSRALVNSMNDRFDRAVRELDLVSLL